jgi:glycosyltransferase involved in cell wall biosynthesis
MVLMALKVLMVTNMYPSPERPGWGSFVKSQIDSLVDKGVEVEVFVIDGYKSTLNYLRAMWAIRRECSRGHYDLVHAHYGLSGLAARAQRRYPLIVSFCGDDLLGTPNRQGRVTFRSRVFVWLHQWLARMVDGVIVKSEAMRRLVPDARAVVIPNGVRFDVFRPMPQQDCRTQLGLSVDRRYVLFPYAPSTIRKNYGLLERAVAIVNAEGSAPLLEIVTVDRAPAAMMPVYLNAVDLLAVVSIWEGSPNTVKEAMACNTKVVATDVGDVREILGGVEGCYLCEPTPEDVARAIQRALAVPVKTEGREMVARLSIEAVADQVIAEYTQVLQNRNRLEPRAPTQDVVSRTHMEV